MPSIRLARSSSALQGAARQQTWLDSFIKGHVQRQDIDRRLAEYTKFAGLDGLIDQRTDLGLIQATRLCNARHLEIGGFRRDMRIKAAAGGGNQIHRHGSAWIASLQCVRFRLDPVEQLRVGRAEIGTAGGSGVIAVTGSGGAAMEIGGTGKGLTNQEEPITVPSFSTRLPPA